MNDLEYKIRVNSSLIKNKVQAISTMNTQINYHYEMFNKKLVEIKKLLKEYENDRKNLIEDLKNYFEYEKKDNIPLNLTFKRLYQNLIKED